MPTPEVRVLTHVDRRFTRGRWVRGRRTRGGLDFCLVAAVDDAAAGFPVEVRSRVMQELVRDLPHVMRPVGRRVPRATLAFYNDWIGRRRGTLRLVKTTLARLSTRQPFTAQLVVDHRPVQSWPADGLSPAGQRAPRGAQGLPRGVADRRGAGGSPR